MRIAMLLLPICMNAQVASVPRFSDFKVTTIYQGKRALPRIMGDKRDYPGFRAALNDAAKPVNFAGRYVISEDTCGTDSVRLMITDAISGRVREAFCIYWDYTIARHDLPIGIEYRRDSSLLIAHGCWDDEHPKCGDHYYYMTAGGLMPLRWIPFSPPIQDLANAH